MKNRLFIALKIDDELVDDIINIRKEIYPDDNFTKWERKEKLHLTLKFLGEVELDKISEIAGKLNDICNKNEPIQIVFSKFGIFRDKSKPRVLWLGLHKTNSLKKLFFDIDDGLSDIGFEKERRSFRPHLTLLRLKGNEVRTKIETFKNYEVKISDSISTEVDIIQSELLPTGSVHKKVKSFRLNKGESNG